jgi:hypothetical protein
VSDILDTVSKYVNDGADLVIDGLGLRGDCPETDAINLVVNAAAFLVENPDGTFDGMVRACYDTDPDEVRDWWDW